ncbi:sulfur relay (sulfurtransferase) DsrF/TusC family protein [Streptacidiphilus sp. MAP12-20]|uniref:MarR family transcriptional regulator n=1 Tax=Streptacidiphilus sp. MAP12-20 TaxID=3156299 RepID=UPI0035186E97
MALPTSRQSEAIRGSHPALLGFDRLPPAAVDLILLGDLTGRYATGSYTRRSSSGALVRREDRQGVADHGHRITAAIACHVARAGGTADQLTRLLLHPDHEGGRHAQIIELRFGQARARAYIDRVWASASAEVAATVSVGSRHGAHEDLVGLRERIETTPWRGERGRTALRVLRAHLNFAETAGGRLHAASERQTAEEAGISRQTLRNAYEAVLKPGGWLRRLRVGHGTEGSTWYLGNGPASPLPSRVRTSQCPPDEALGEWSTPETAATPETEVESGVGNSPAVSAAQGLIRTAPGQWSTPETTGSPDVDSRVIGRLMANDAFAYAGLGSSALLVIGALHANPGQSAAELVASSSVSRATVYRTLQRLHGHGLVQQNDSAWTLTTRALEGIGAAGPQAVTGPASGWDGLAAAYGTAGTAAARKAFHAAERAAYRAALAVLAEHRTPALTIVRDGQTVLIPAQRADEIPAHWRTPDGSVLDPVTRLLVPGWRVATDGRLILHGPGDQLTYDELVAANTLALQSWETAA